ncbi:Nif11-like leader peptide family natural product precursor [Azomonas macrocytogenes]|uniref:Putative ribosomally synthesized peptide with nif11-like leader n=1 Tax=Azomonas macrocytogenes TaxID=69962 RepID=A0A839T558_AZOMA|nr:Nif11-like leader peptide family natural product precursor [Azomonas macrocytogenes]MBB3103910.1 putative ribosomally synthesized peptide with nif11-like leader [Azomonas macrocytogenes]
MSIKEVHAFSEKAKADQVLAEKLKACEKTREMIALAKEHGHSIIEDALYPPNEPQFTKDQLSPKLAKALLGG